MCQADHNFIQVLFCVYLLLQKLYQVISYVIRKSRIFHLALEHLFKYACRIFRPITCHIIRNSQNKLFSGSLIRKVLFFAIDQSKQQRKHFRYVCVFIHSLLTEKTDILFFKFCSFLCIIQHIP